MTDDWAAITRERIEAFRRDRPLHVSVHGERIVAGLESFYAAVDGLFSGGLLGGLRMTARKAEEPV